MFKRNVALSNSIKVSNWRKSAVGTYAPPSDCEVYCIQSIDIEPALNYIANHQDKLTLTHLAGKAAGLMIRNHSEINRIIRFGRFYERDNISIFFQVAVDKEGKDLSGHTVRSIDKLSLNEIKQDMNKTVKEIKKGNDVNYKKVKSTMSFIPSVLVYPFIKIYGFILYSLNLWSPLFGAPKDSFGSMMITNIGTLGMQTALVPLVPFSRCPLILALGEVYEKPVVKKGQIVIQKTVDCCWTLDHRIIDGVVGAKMAQNFKDLMENPQDLEVK
jgi:pyruvate/2-oxoglutarate dehydrogenase complex dihydrolipoamide acyltransferase (E2) component